MAREDVQPDGVDEENAERGAGNALCGGAEAGAADNVSVSDTFSPILYDISVTYDGAQIEKNVGYTYDESTGEFATVPGEITVPAAAFIQDETSGEWSCEPGSVTLTVKGTI